MMQEEPSAAFYLEVINGRGGTQGVGAPAVPLVERVPGFRAQHFSSLVLLEVPDEGHGSVGAGQVVAPWTWTERAAASSPISP